MKRLRFGIIGMGSIGLVHFKALQRADLELVGYSSAKQKVLEGDFREIKCNLGVQGEVEDVSKMNRVVDHRTLLQDPSVDAVIIAAPTSRHYHIANQALQVGKHVFVEKPETAAAQSASQLNEAFEKSGKRIVVGHCLPFFPAFRWLHDTLRQPGALGSLQKLSMTRKILEPENGFTEQELRRSMGPGIDLGIHDAHFIIGALGIPDGIRASGTRMHGYPTFLRSTFHYKRTPASITTHCGALPDVPNFSHSFVAEFTQGSVKYDGKTLVAKLGSGTSVIPLGNEDITSIFAAQLQCAESYLREDSDPGPLDPIRAQQALAIVEAQTRSAMNDEVIEDLAA